MRGDFAAVAVLLSVLSLSSCASAPPSRPTAFDPPLTAGMAREYANDFETVRGVVRELMSTGPRELVSEEAVDSSTVVFRTKLSAKYYGVSPLPELRVVVQSPTPDRTVVRVFDRATGMGSPTETMGRNLFREIEFGLK